MTAERPDRRLLLTGLLLVLPIPLCWLIFTMETPPITRSGYIGIEGFTYRTDYNHALMGIVALVSSVAALVVALVNGSRAWLRSHLIRRLLTVATLALVTFGAVLYFYGSRVARTHYPWFQDSYHYLLGPKYFAELGYDGLYGCHLQADAQRPQRRYADTDRVTDLTRDEAAYVRDVRASADCAEFSAERWEEFQRDVLFYDLTVRKQALRDRGYNGTPFHTVVAGTLANLVRVDYETVLGLTFIDLTAICLLLAAVSWVFGWRVGCVFALFVFTNFADRFNFIGASFFRYIWFACLVLGLTLMKKERHGVAAVLMVAAAMLNVFPLLFFAGIGVKIVFEWWEHRRIDPKHRTFVIWAVAATLAFGVVSLAQRNPVSTYGKFLGAMRHHSRELTSMRVGFQYDFLFRGEILKSDAVVSYDDKADDLRRLRPVYYTLAGAVLILGVLVARRLDDLSATVLVGFLLFFLWFSTVSYYYAVTALLLLLWHRPEDRRVGLIFASILFGLTAGIYLLWYLTDNHLKFLNNTAMSTMLTVYVAGVLGYYVHRERGALWPWRRR